MERPYRAIGYPFLPALYLIMAVFLEIQLLRYKPQYTWPGLIIVVLGVPVYWLWKMADKSDRSSDDAAPEAG
jgi:APA family basic amino acid/polyamine antiporter